MKFFSTNRIDGNVSFRTAVMRGLAEDGGLFMPEFLPKFDQSFFENITDYTFQEIAYKVARLFVGQEIPNSKLKDIIDESINFPANVKILSDNMGILELFYGPTLAFKDFGARFMARVISYFLESENKELNILVATSGDTGSAVANGFYEIPGINVFVLYPSKKISEIQEKQITTLNKNITALEIIGTFDDCQRLVKRAFVDKTLGKEKKLSSANSINIARLIPQTFYYFESYKQVKKKTDKIVYSVPSGNLGNLTAGLFASKMGLPVYKFIAATNSNNVFTNYIESGKFIPRPSIQTYSNAMDVGNPSNLARINSLFGSDISEISKVIFSESFNDDDTLEGIREIYNKYEYIIDPHGSVAYLAMEKFFSENKLENVFGVVLETAHYSKFEKIVKKAVHRKLEMPDRLKSCLSKPKHSIKLSNDFESFKKYLLS